MPLKVISAEMQGAAVKQNINGEVEERNYVDGRLNGKELDNFIFIHIYISLIMVIKVYVWTAHRFCAYRKKLSIILTLTVPG